MTGSSAKPLLTPSIVKAETAEEFCLIESWPADERILKYLGPPVSGREWKHTAMAFASRKGVSVLFIVILGQGPAGVVGYICQLNLY